VNDLCLVPIGSIPHTALDWIESAVAEWFPLPVLRLPLIRIPDAAFDPKRKQYQSVEIMKLLAQSVPRNASRILGVVNVDLAIPMLTFLFGQAQFDGPVGLISLCRLHQEFYGLPPQEALLRERTVKEVLHELGHTFGLVHCPERTCAMSLATHIELVDAKAERFCDRCGLHLVKRFSQEAGI
jgi:archaemetzincin